MHYNIRILSQGESRQDARAHAFVYATQLVDEGTFDYYTVEGSTTHKLASALGKKAVEGALAANRREFDEAIHAARLMIEHYTDDQIYDDDYPNDGRDFYASRWQFSQVSNGHCYLYADLHDDRGIWTGKVSTDRDLHSAVGERDDLWVTSMGFHN